MPIVIAGEELVEAVRNQTFIRHGDTECAEGIKYDLRLGPRLLKAGKNPFNIKELPEVERSQLCLDPGEMAFVLTEETLDLPKDMIAMLSPKRKLSHEGILVLGGFLIDPLYRGNLLVGLYNFSSSRWPLQAGKKLIAAVFYRLAGGELSNFIAPEEIDDFPDPLVRVMRNYTPATVGGLQDLIQQTQRDLATLRDEFRSQEDWKKMFRESLDRHDAQIGELVGSIKDLKKTVEDERVNRLTKESQLSADLGQIHKRGDKRSTFWVAIGAGAIGAVLGAILAYLLPKMFGN